MSEEDQKFLETLIARTQSSTCAAAVVALGVAIRRWVSACSQWEFARWEPGGEIKYAAAAEWSDATLALKGLVV